MVDNSGAKASAKQLKGIFDQQGKMLGSGDKGRWVSNENLLDDVNIRPTESIDKLKADTIVEKYHSAAASRAHQNKSTPYTSIKNKEECGPWAEIAKFNQLLDYKIRLDNAEESKRKVTLQREFLDVQIRARQKGKEAESKMKTV